jgi:hypothetical protein
VTNANILPTTTAKGPKSQYDAVRDGEIAMEIQQWIRKDLDKDFNVSSFDFDL